MVLVALAMCALGVVLGAAGVVHPEVLVGVIRVFLETPIGLYAAAGIRLVFSVALFFAAPSSRAPRTLRVLGTIGIVGALAMPLVGVEGLRGQVVWYSALDPSFLRTHAVFTLGFSALLACVLFRGRAPTNEALPLAWHSALEIGV